MGVRTHAQRRENYAHGGGGKATEQAFADLSTPQEKDMSCELGWPKFFRIIPLI